MTPEDSARGPGDSLPVQHPSLARGPDSLPAPGKRPPDPRRLPRRPGGGAGPAAGQPGWSTSEIAKEHTEDPSPPPKGHGPREGGQELSSMLHSRPHRPLTGWRELRRRGPPGAGEGGTDAHHPAGGRRDRGCAAARGRPTGVKWGTASRKVISKLTPGVNADESEPGACKDIPADAAATQPRLIEGAIITSFARPRPSSTSAARCCAAGPARVAEACEAGSLGHGVPASGYELDIMILAPRAGTYVLRGEKRRHSRLAGEFSGAGSRWKACLLPP